MATVTYPSKPLRSNAIRARSGVLAVLLCKPDGDIKVGSGFVIKKNDQGRPIAITCYHVLASFKKEKGHKLFVRAPLSTGGVQQVEASIIHQNAGADLAILQLEKDLIGGAQVMRFADTGVTVGSSCFGIGYVNPVHVYMAQAVTRTATICPGVVRETGVCKGPSRSFSHVNTVLVVCDCICCKGMSGGPVLASGGVIGVISSGHAAEAISISLETIRDVLKEMNGDYSEGGPMNRVLARVN